LNKEEACNSISFSELCGLGKHKILPSYWTLLEWPSIKLLKERAIKVLSNLKLHKVNWVVMNDDVNGIKFTLSDGSSTPNEIGLSSFCCREFLFGKEFDCC